MSRLFDYTLQSISGVGVFSNVYKAKGKYCDETYAIKFYDHKEVPHTVFENERDCLKKFNNKNVITLIGYFTIYDEEKNPKSSYIVLEYVPKNLSQITTIKNTKKVIKQLLEGINHIHSKGIIHADIKPENILIDDKETVKICDFNLSSYTDDKKKNDYVQTRPYRSVELMFGMKDYGKEIDIWALGCLILRMIYGKNYFYGDNEVEQMFSIFQVLGTPNSDTWEDIDKLPEYKSTYPKWKRMSDEQIKTC